MKKIFICLVMTAFAVSFSNANNFIKSNPAVSTIVTDNSWCNKFTITVNFGFGSISTQVNICCINLGMVGAECWSLRQGESGQNNLVLIRVADIVKDIKNAVDPKSLDMISVTKCEPQFFDGIQYEIKTGEYKVKTIDNERVIEAVILQSKK